MSNGKYTVGVDGRLYNGKGTKGGLAPVRPKEAGKYNTPPKPPVISQSASKLSNKPNRLSIKDLLSFSTLKAELTSRLKHKTERQAHGLHNEDRVKSKFGLLDYVGKNYYITKYDAQTIDGTPVSIKTEKLGTDIELADYFRNARIAEDFYMVVSFWSGKKTNIVEEYHVKFPHREWQKFFNHSVDEKINNLLKDASNDRSYDDEWKRNIKELKDEYGDNIIRLRPKRDHGKQLRMQCAISYQDFMKLYEIYKTEDIRKHRYEAKGNN
jgi:hypothetical protein